MIETITAAPASRLPVQVRSRASTDRMLASATELFVAGGYEAVTASEVGRRAGVAVGTIYSRFVNKDGLVRAVQSALLAQFEQAVRDRAASPEWTKTPPPGLMATLIHTLAQLLADHAAILQPVMKHAAVDPETAMLGKSGYEQLRTAFLHAAERAWPLMHHADPAGAVDSCFKIAYATFARALGLGSSPDAADVAGLPKLAADLGAMCEAFLLRAPG